MIDRLNSRIRFALALLMLGLPLRLAMAQWTPAQLDTLAQAFATGISASYGVDPRPWHFMVGCDIPDCDNNNPDTVYGFPNFGNDPGALVLSRALLPTAALVFVLETPPPMRYFGATAYMGNRYYAKLPSKPQVSGVVAVNESLTDTTNLAVLGTTGDTQPGVNPFGQLAVFVTTADATTLAAITAQFTALGFPASAINLLPLPISVQPPVPLAMGTDATSDTYTVALRLTYPLDPAQQADYLQRAPVRAFHLAPRTLRAPTPLPPTAYRTPGTGIAEPTALRRAQGQLINQLLAQYASQFPFVNETRVLVKQTVNYDAIAKGKSSAYDNPDAIYTVDAGGGGGVSLGAYDRILVVGVNHSSPTDGTGKAVYFSHALQTADGNRGVLGVPDTALARSGLIAGGVTDPGDRRYDTYRRLYAFTVAFNCPPGDLLCITIPQDNGGLPVGTPLLMAGRIYLETATQTRPSKDELIIERAFVLSKTAAAVP